MLSFAMVGHIISISLSFYLASTPFGSFQKIARETWGQCLLISDVAKLPKLITGLAEKDLEKLKLFEEIDRKIKQFSKLILDLTEEDERCKFILRKLSESKTKVKVLLDNTVTDKDVTLEDVKEGICTLRRMGRNVDICKYFPTLGVAQQTIKPGLVNSKDKSSVPLTGVAIFVKIVNFACEVELVQNYTNTLDQPIEAGMLNMYHNF